jgi:hypothetical protein
VLAALTAPLAASLSRGVARFGSVAAQVELTLAGAVLLTLASLLLTREIRRGRAKTTPISDEAWARAVMGELCPNGWRAQINLHGGGELLDATTPSPAAVSVDWSELGDSFGEPPAMHRVWASTVASALSAMVEDRRADEVLERIERAASSEDDPWDGS